ncbi:hypothetical protein KEF29_17370 [Streptomyces tuirus]|uniref:Uncharacterized protein n=1 Tax=Streptomyces tuirus TaxID=68278 RepID=A0A941FCY2_9ACTN|nr:hypothetical protein [Streptomyces tuirus]
MAKNPPPRSHRPGHHDQPATSASESLAPMITGHDSTARLLAEHHYGVGA